MEWAVIFDVDGVLVDSAEAHFASWQRLATESGNTFDRAAFARTFGRTSRSILLDEFDGALTDDAIRELDDRKESLYRDIVSRSFPAMPGAETLIHDLHRAGARLAVGSSGPPENVNLVLERLGCAAAFSAVVTGKDVTRGKPDPQVSQIAAKRLDIEPHRCIVVEDAPAGIEAAHAAGMKCAALISSGRSATDLAAAELVVYALTDINASDCLALLDG